MTEQTEVKSAKKSQGKKEAAAQAAAEAAAQAAQKAELDSAKETKALEIKLKAEAEKAAKAEAKEAAKLARELERQQAKEEKLALKQAQREEKQRLKEASKMPESRGVRRPKPDTQCGKAWAIFDEVSAKNGAPASIRESIEIAKPQGLNIGNVKSEYARWRTFFGISGRVSPPVVEKSEAAAVH